MRLLILGATGNTGHALVEQALARGHHVTAFGRSPLKVTPSAELESRQGNALDAGELKSVLPGQEAVLSAIGSKGVGPTTVRAQGAKSIADAMLQARVSRLVILSSALVEDDQSWFTRLLARTVMKHIAGDQRELERHLTPTALDWTIVRPHILTNGKLTKKYTVLVDGQPASRSMMSRADAAHFMLDTVERREHVRSIVRLGGGR